MRDRIEKSFVRGFKAAVKGLADEPQDTLDSSFTEGYVLGMAALARARRKAKEYAGRVVIRKRLKAREVSP